VTFINGTNILSSVEHGSNCPQGADIKVPNASFNYDDFISIRMKKSILPGMHGHESWILL
jgi:hypothetical protein